MRPRLSALVLGLVCSSLLAAGCSDDASPPATPQQDDQTTSVAGQQETTTIAGYGIELETLIEPLALDEPPAGATLVDSYVQELCQHPGIDTDPPEVYYGYDIAPDAEAAVIAEFILRLEGAGWHRNDANAGIGFDGGSPGEEAHAGIGTDGPGVDVNVWLDFEWAC